jgi:hypothetical protein
MTGVFNRQDEFNVRPGENIYLSEICQRPRYIHPFFHNSQSICIDFHAYDDDMHTYLSRSEILERYDRWNMALRSYYGAVKAKTSLVPLTPFIHFNTNRYKPAEFPYA